MIEAFTGANGFELGPLLTGFAGDLVFLRVRNGQVLKTSRRNDENEPKSITEVNRCTECRGCGSRKRGICSFQNV